MFGVCISRAWYVYDTQECTSLADNVPQANMRDIKRYLKLYIFFFTIPVTVEVKLGR